MTVGLYLWVCLYLLWATVTSFLHPVVGQTCSSTGLIGDDRPQGSSSDTNNFYLNANSPASCGGMITGFNYSFFAPITGPQSTTSYSTVFAVYRQTGTMNNMPVYSVVSENYLVTVPQSQSISGAFRSSYLPLSSPVSVEAGDILGACVNDPPGEDTYRLDIVGTAPSSGDKLLVASSGECNAQSVPSSITNGLNEQVAILLHLHANIEPFPVNQVTTTNGDSSPQTTPATVTVDETTNRDVFTSTSTSDEPDTTVGPDQTTIMNSDGPVTMTNGDVTNATTTLSTAVQSGSQGVTAAVVIIVIIVLLALVGVGVAVAMVTVVLIRRVSLKRKSCDLSKGGTTQQSFPVNVLSQPIYEFDDEVCASTGFNTSQENAYAEVGLPVEAGGKDNPNYQPHSRGSPVILSFAKLLEKNKEEDIYAYENPYETPATQEDEIYAQLKGWGIQNICSAEIEIVRLLGSGQFGSVEQGVWKREGTRPVDVALKSLNKTSEEDKVKFLQEAAIMAQFRHPNIIKLHGVVTRGTPMKLVTELAERGDLQVFLQSLVSPGELVPSGTPKMLLKFSQQVALGMQYLSAKGFVHRDLAARNVLVTKSNVCKVADFGLSRDLEDENYYFSRGKDKMPVKWTAPEAIQYKKYSTASDVWTYGCLLYEIWSLGHKPFKGVANKEVVKKVVSGERLPSPPGCPKLIYALMIESWHPDTSQRPTFRDIVLTLVGSEEKVLNIPEEDSSTSPLAGVLGAPLEAGENMYSDLHNKYQT